ncbi:BTB/POZ domain-containing protein 9-like [Oppia nitens]|uniref:BTB/POZ domain-containing protein 9-like n=1 Tax=Oppia nitens TaxID=1686743 RepID=UPI0023DA6D45|nr:BTB/POZ domain-containing protein 9-like [Oppia nitens]
MVFDVKEDVKMNSHNMSLNGDGNGIAIRRGVIDGKNDLLQQIGGLYMNDQTSDIKLKVEGQVLPAHKSIVSARSQYFFKQIFGTDGGAGDHRSGSSLKGGTLEMFGTTASALKMVLKYLYCGELVVEDLGLEVIIDVLTLSHRCKLLEIVSGISNYLKDIVAIDNVWTIYSASNLFEETNSLAEFCLRFMDSSAVKLLNHETTYAQTVSNFKLLINRKTFDAPEVEKFKAVYKWINNNPELDSKDLVNCVNLQRLGQEELLQVVRPTHLVTDSQILDAITPKRKRVSLDTSTNTETIKMEAIEFTPKFTIKTMKHETEAVGYYYFIELTEPYEINHIKMRLSELISGKGEYSYFIETSIDNEKWMKVIDYSKFICRSWQQLFFDNVNVKYIKVVGTKPDGKIADIIIDSFDCSYSHSAAKQENGFIIPTEDIANLDCGTRIRYPINRHDLYLLHSTQRYAYFIPVRNFGDDLKKNAFNIQLAQPYLLDSLEFKIYHKDSNDSYRYYVEVSADEKSWERIIDRTDNPGQGLQVLKFSKLPVCFVRIVGTAGVGPGCSKFLGCSALRCPAISNPEDE